MVGRSEHRRRLSVVLDGVGPDEGATEGHEERRTHALVGHIGDEDPQPSVREREDVIEVAGRLPGRLEHRRELPSGNVRQRAGQEVGLDLPRQSHLSIDALMGQLLGVDLGPVQRRGDLRRERLDGRQQARGVVRVAPEATGGSPPIGSLVSMSRMGATTSGVACLSRPRAGPLPAGSAAPPSAWPATPRPEPWSAVGHPDCDRAFGQGRCGPRPSHRETWPGRARQAPRAGSTRRRGR